MNFSTNQNRQLYVVTGVVSGGGDFSDNANAKVFTNAKEGYKYVQVKGVDKSGVERTDLIYDKSIMWASATAAEDMQHVLKVYKLLLDSTVNSGAPIAGQDYVLRINFRQLYGMSDEDIYQKYGAVHAYSDMTASNFYKEMVYSLVKNFSRLYSPLIDIAVNSATNIVTKATKTGNTTSIYVNGSASAFNTDITAIYFIEKSQVNDWVLGTSQIIPVQFEVIPTTITDASHTEVIWGTVTDETFTTTTENEGTDSETTTTAPTVTPVGNGYTIADLEYFCMGERGDQYRNVGWPKSIKTEYQVDPTKEYYTLDVQFAYRGSCEDFQKSEKTVTFVAQDGVEGTEAAAVIDDLIEALGLTDIVQKSTHYPDSN